MSRDLKLNGTIEAAGYSGGPVSGTTGTFTDAYLARFGFVLESKNAGTLAKVLLD